MKYLFILICVFLNSNAVFAQKDLFYNVSFFNDLVTCKFKNQHQYGFLYSRKAVSGYSISGGYFDLYDFSVITKDSQLDLSTFEFNHIVKIINGKPKPKIIYSTHTYVLDCFNDSTIEFYLMDSSRFCNKFRTCPYGASDWLEYELIEALTFYRILDDQDNIDLTDSVAFRQPTVFSDTPNYFEVVESNLVDKFYFKHTKEDLNSIEMWFLFERIKYHLYIKEGKWFLTTKTSAGSEKRYRVK